MRYSVLLSALFTAKTLAINIDFYTFIFYSGIECKAANVCIPCGTTGCPKGTECGTWGGVSDSCCQAINLGIAEASCSEFSSVLQNFDLTKDGTALTGPTKVGEDCPNPDTAVPLSDYMVRGAEGCCSGTDNIVALNVVGDPTIQKARCLPSAQLGKPAGSGAASSGSGTMPAATSAASSASVAAGTESASKTSGGSVSSIAEGNKSESTGTEAPQTSTGSPTSSVGTKAASTTTSGSTSTSTHNAAVRTTGDPQWLSLFQITLVIFASVIFVSL
ncbi:hypothetical protein H072_4437 [Dactylellina haptotyla CBS 200.50]|uniref:Uncharacterized protein n=1 Tax=Dactylellina haptotyla (strain CBS 200.50) TaxID=1284197 RepID=S8AFH1_DACHA|nr:hypothetical protein H072_4437 [Dactylellina haptotyla CBS 200.50]